MASSSSGGAISTPLLPQSEGDPRSFTASSGTAAVSSRRRLSCSAASLSVAGIWKCTSMLVFKLQTSVSLSCISCISFVSCSRK
ncbi:hypothetical protein NMG60_11026725 [Bertholletia excelsa]